MGINYSVEADPDTTAKGMLRDRPISIKHSKAISRAIKGMPVADAEEYLEAVIDGERSVPFKQHNSGVGHRSDIDGWDAGRYPEKACKAFLDLLENAVGNADRTGVRRTGHGDQARRRPQGRRASGSQAPRLGGRTRGTPQL